MPDPHPTAVVEVDHFSGLTEPQHVGSQHTMMRGKRCNVVFPSHFGAGPVLAAVEQNNGIALPRFEIAGGEAVHRDGLAFKIHYAPVDRAKVRTCVAIISSWLLIVSSANSQFSSKIWSAELIATPSGVGHALSACPIFRRWLSVLTAACQPYAHVMQPHGVLSR